MIILSTGVPLPPVIKNKEKEISLPGFKLSWNSFGNHRCISPLTMNTVYYKAIESPNKEKSQHHINTTAMTNTLSGLPLDCDTEYEFAVSAWNEFGESKMSQSLQGRVRTGNAVSCFYGLILFLCGQ